MNNRATKNAELDRIDHSIIRILSQNGRMSIAELSKRVGLSPTPCRLRLENLIKGKFILGFYAQLNAEKLNRNHVTFVEVKLEKTDQRTFEAFNAAIQAIPEIEQAHMIAGRFDYLLKIRTKSIEDYRRILGEVISNLPAVQSTSTNVAMEAVKEPGEWA